MIESIVATLAEFGLIRDDYKHRKRINKLTIEDGKTRPVRKYLLQPSILLIIGVSALVIAILFLFFNPITASIYHERTQKELAEMNERMEHWNEKLGRYPADLNELIGNDPIKQDWAKDAWQQPYKFELFENGKGFLITSAGRDGQFGTLDDIKSR